MRRTSLIVLAAALATTPLAAQQSAFIIRLGRDTAAIERVTRSASHLEADAVIRQPRTTVRHLVLDFGPNGRLTRAEMTIARPDAPAGAAPLQHSVATFSGDSMAVETHRDTAVIRRRYAVPNGIFIVAGAASSFLTHDLLAARLRASRQDSIAVQVIGFGGTAAGSWSAKTLGRDSVLIFDGNNTFRVRVDRDGHVLGALPTGGTQQFTIERVGTADINALATAFAARDAQGQNLGALSTRDTVRATTAGATLWIDYGRPAKRGREIFGTTIVPWGEVWRLGANAATQFRTDRALDMGGVTVPAGFYTLWAIPQQGGSWKLLINSQTGQWGTAHDATKDLFQLDLPVSRLPQPAERFTIAVQPTAQGGVLQFDWDTTRASIPFTVR